MLCCFVVFFVFFNDTATTEIYTLSLHDALPISGTARCRSASRSPSGCRSGHRSEEHTSELQSPCNLVCRLLLEKKQKKQKNNDNSRNLQRYTRLRVPARVC